MKIFNTDEKHFRVTDELDLGDISVKEELLIERVLDFINRNSSRYQQYRTGNTAKTIYEDGDPIDLKIE